MTTLRPPRDGDLAMVKERRFRGRFDMGPTLARYRVILEPDENDGEELGYWQFFGVEFLGRPSDYDIHYYVTTTRLVGFAAE